MISQEIINRMGVTRGTSTFPNGNGKICIDGETGVGEEGTIGDELDRGVMSVHLQLI